MTYFSTSVLAVMLPSLLATVSFGMAGDRAYVTAFQTGEIVSVNLQDGNLVKSIPVQDSDGIAGLAANPQTGTLFVVDGASPSRLRIFDAHSLTMAQEHQFPNRVLRFSNDRLLHLSRDGKWLFLSTYNYPDAARGVRIFDVNGAAFLQSGLRNRACEEPLLTSTASGTIFALCPGIMQEITPQPNIPGDFAPRTSVKIELHAVTAAALTPNGNDLFALGVFGDDKGYKLLHWDRGTGKAEYFDIAQIVGTSDMTAEQGRFGWIDITSDGETVAVVLDADAWLLNRASLAVRTHHKLPSPALAVAITPDGQNIVSLHAGERLNLVAAPIAGGDLKAIPISQSDSKVGPTSLVIAPAN